MKGFPRVNSPCVDLRPFFETKVSKPISLWQNTLVAHVDYPLTMLPKWQKHLPHKLHSQHFTLQWKLLVMAKHGELFESKILAYVQQLITRLCPLHVYKHRFIVHNSFIMINREAQFTMTYRYNELRWNDISFALWDIVVKKSHSLIYRIHEMFRLYIGDKSRKIRTKRFFVNYRLHYFCTIL